MLEYTVKFLDASTKDIVDDVHSCDYLPTISCETKKPNMDFSKAVIKSQEILNFLEALSRESISEESFGSCHVDSPLLYVSEPEVALLWVQTAHFSLPTRIQTAKFRGQSFYSTAKTVLVEPHERFRN